MAQPPTHWLTAVVEAAYGVSPAQYCQAIFVMLGAATLAMNVLPAGTQRYLLDYGARDTKAAGAATGTSKPTKLPLGNFERLVATLAAHSQVPHAWFASFYAAYLVLTLGWVLQAWLWGLDGPPYNLFGWLVAHQTRAERADRPPLAAAATFVRVCAAGGLETLQAGRRLYEHVAVLKSSPRSTMNIAHWALGLAFYVCMSVAVWIEGSHAIAVVMTQQFSSPTFLDAAVGIKLLVGTSLFLFAGVQQYRCHVHLASLKKYSLPEEGLFRYLVCPHYTCECLLYLSLSILAAPQGRLFNQTLLSSVFFVVCCLGVTANRTKRWYIDRFGADRVSKKWRMIPFVF